jgi:branched-subunit amino acid permease
MNALLFNIYYEGEFLNTLIDVNYTINVAYTIFISNNINFRDLRKQIHIDVGLLTKQYNLIIKAQQLSICTMMDKIFHKCVE